MKDTGRFTWWDRIVNTWFRSRYVQHLERENERLIRQNWELWRTLAHLRGVKVADLSQIEPPERPAGIPREKAPPKPILGRRINSHLQRKQLEAEARKQAAAVDARIKQIQEQRAARERAPGEPIVKTTDG